MSAAGFLGACRQQASSDTRTGDSLFTALKPRLPTGVKLDPAAPLATVGPMPLTMRVAPEGDRVVLSLGGYREQGIQVVDATSGKVLQTLPQASAFVGLAFSPDGRTLYSSGGNQDVVYRYDWANGRAAFRDSISLGPRTGRGNNGTRYPAGLAPSPDGHFLYVAENLSDSLAVIDLSSRQIVQRFSTERYPYDVVVDKAGAVYVSAWGGYTVSAFTTRSGPTPLQADGRIAVARHPSALALNADGTRLFVASGSTDHVAVIDTKRKRVIARLLDPPPAGPREGATPNGLSLSSDGTRLFVAEADANAVAVFDLTAATSNVASATGTDALSGRIPSGWYTCALVQVGSDLLVASGKGRGSVANLKGPTPRASGGTPAMRGPQYSLALIDGGLMRVPLADTRGDALAKFTTRVAVANGWNGPSRLHRYPRFEHVIYIIKENRTYDQVFGDDPQGDGDSSLVFFPRAISANHHALADRFGLFDRFFVNAEVSPDGHNWSMAAYATDYLEKTVPSNYSQRGRSYDYEGLNRGAGLRSVPEDDVAEPADGYLWNLAEKKGITFRNYGEFVVPSGRDPGDALPAGYRGNKPFLFSHTNPLYPGFDLAIQDQHRADIWIDELKTFSAKDSMPALEIVRLPNDHTSGLTAGSYAPLSAFADNDLALGRMIEALSKSPFWKNTVVFVLEDDAQNGADHVDAHRSTMLVISAYNRPGAIHRFVNTTDVLRTIEEILGLDSMSQFDYFGRPLRDIWTSDADLRPYSALTPAVSLDERNPRGTRGARASAKLDFGVEDAADETAFNDILWRAIKGPNVPYSAVRRASARDLRIEP
ncbi:MAG: beta-propeller fold lactonase family protein [Gemmatimonadaceae bacterium]